MPALISHAGCVAMVLPLSAIRTVPATEQPKLIVLAEEELPDIEAFTEYSLQRRANIVVYNEFADLQQSNIGIGIEVSDA